MPGIDEKYMSMALSLAKKGIGRTSPNPAVGAILVKNGRVIAAAYHKKAGSPHAEALVIRKAGKAASGSTLYCTMEACTYFGKTPPCTAAIINAGIKRAVFAGLDPNPMNYKKGVRLLMQAGIKTQYGILSREAERLNRPFSKFIKTGVTYVTLKMAQSLDGKIADSSGRSKWISSRASRRLVRKMRSASDAILIGVNTLIKDNPLLFAGQKPGTRRPLRVIADSKLMTPLYSRILRKSSMGKAEVIIAGAKGASLKKKYALEQKGETVVLFARRSGKVDLAALMKYLAGRQVMSVLCEGGGELSASLLKSRLVDELVFFVSPQIIGGKNAPTSCGGPDSDMRRSVKLKDINVERSGKDIVIKGLI